MRVLFKGFRFGMLLQLAIGPICLLVFKTAATKGIVEALILICSVSLVDAAFIFLSAVGASKLLSRDAVKRAVKIYGSVILLIFGLDIILGAFDVTLLPRVGMINNFFTENIFLEGLVITSANPLTIIFWSGVFATEIADSGFGKKEIFKFGTGCVLSTTVSLCIVAIIGIAAKMWLSPFVILVANVIVGIIIIGLALKLLIKKDEVKIEG